MNKFIFTIVVTLVSANFAAAEYNQPEDKTVEQLDVLKTCGTAAQKDTAERVLNFMFNFKWWHIKNMVDGIHSDYVHWHAPRVFWASITPEDKWDKLPYKKGIVTHATFLEDLAMVAYYNNVSQYINDIKRIECVGHDLVVMSSVFNGVNVLRDSEGYITHEYALKDIPTRFTFVVRDGKMYRIIWDLEDHVTVNLFKALGELRKTPPMPKDEATRTTYQQILEKFKKEAGLN